MNKKILLYSAFLIILLSSITLYASAVSYIYDLEIVGKNINGDPVYKALTDDPGMAGGKVRFWLWLGTDCDGGRDNISPFIPFALEGSDINNLKLVAYYVFPGYGDTVVCVKAHFQGELYSAWSTCITIPWFTSLPVVMLISIGGVAYLKKRKRL